MLALNRAAKPIQANSTCVHQKCVYAHNRKLLDFQSNQGNPWLLYTSQPYLLKAHKYCFSDSNKQLMSYVLCLKVNIPANSTWSGLLSYFQGIKIKRFTKW
jgi:hypothetical protein